MKRFMSLVLWSTLLCALLGTAVPAMVVPPLDLSRHADSSGCICVGKLLTYDVVRSGDKREVVVTFRVDRVLKGDVQVGSVIEIRRPGSGQLPHFFSGYDLIAVNKLADGKYYEFARKALATMPSSEKVFSPYQQSADVKSNLRWEVLNSLQSRSPVVAREAMEQVAILSPQDVFTYVGARTNDSDISVRALALKCCIEAGGDNFVVPALQLATSQPFSREGANASALFDLRATLEDVKIKDEHVALLTQSLSSESVEVRRFAHQILRRSNSPAALRFFKTALSDPDEMVRYSAVMGLAEGTRDFGNAPSFEKFKRNEQYYLDYWSSKGLPAS
jgi:hypothetical protein